MPRPDPGSHDPVGDEPDARRYGRRAFLLVVAGGLSSLAWASPARHAVSGALRPATDILPKQLRALAPSQSWRIYTVAPTMPRFEPAAWRLRIDGLVEEPRELTYHDLLALLTSSRSRPSTA